ncbi:MAG: toll/interleukin-1 receptor domain-containing protein, partial [Acidobacteria bacterium]|nr:toll/interleukin-1 receptor domain-containing protein [Acidobacteriota bacterium]
MQSVGQPHSFPYDVFISYSRSTRAFARALERALRNYRPPKDLGEPYRYLKVCRDDSDFIGNDYDQVVEEHLKNSHKLIVLCSPEARESQFVNGEIRIFARQIDRIGARTRIIPILVAGIPNNEAEPGQEDEMAFPIALCEVIEKPLAVNFIGFDPGKDRVNKGIFRESWYKTVAKIYGIPPLVVE